MTGNPYQSPADVGDTARARHKSRRALLRIFGIGLFFGSIVGGTCGAAHAAIVAVTAILIQVFEVAPMAAPTDSMPEFAIAILSAATICGALVGCPIGLVIGLILGVLAGVLGPQARRPFFIVGIATATCSGAIASRVFAINSAQSLPADFVVSATTLASGTLAGFLGGLWLVRGLAKLAWPQTAHSGAAP